MDVDKFADNAGWVVDNLEKMPDVKLLKLSGLFDSGLEKPISLTIHFEDVLGMMQPVVHFGGNRCLYGPAAMSKVFKDIVIKKDQEILMEVWGLLVEYSEKCKNFPARVVIDFQYF